MTFSLHTSTVTFDPKALEPLIRHAQFCLNDPEAFRSCVHTLPSAEKRLPLTQAFYTLSQCAQALQRLAFIIDTTVSAADTRITMPADDYDSLMHTLRTLNMLSLIIHNHTTPPVAP